MGPVCCRPFFVRVAVRTSPLSHAGERHWPLKGLLRQKSAGMPAGQLDGRASTPQIPAFVVSLEPFAGCMASLRLTHGVQYVALWATVRVSQKDTCALHRCRLLFPGLNPSSTQTGLVP